MHSLQNTALVVVLCALASLSLSQLQTGNSFPNGIAISTASTNVTAPCENGTLAFDSETDALLVCRAGEWKAVPTVATSTDVETELASLREENAELRALLSNRTHLAQVLFCESCGVCNEAEISSFCPATSGAPSPSPSPTPIPGTVLLIHGDCDTGVDATGRHTLSANGNAAISSAHSQFGAGSWHFDGNGDDVFVNDNTNDFLFGTNDFTVSLWFRMDAPVVSGYGGLAYSGGENSVQGIFFAVRASGGELYFQSLSSNIIVGPDVMSTLNLWHHAMAVRSGSFMRLYLDGSEVGFHNTGASFTCNSAKPFRIGSANSEYFPGYLDEVLVVNGLAIGDTTVPLSPYLPLDCVPTPSVSPSALPTPSFSPTATPPAYDCGSPYLVWHLDEPVGSTAFDATGNGHHGQMIGGLEFESDAAEGRFSGTQGLNFGGGAYIETDEFNDPIPSVTTMTVSMWFTLDGVDRQVFAMFGTASGNLIELMYHANQPTTTISFNTYSGDIFGFGNANAQYGGEEWHHMVGEFRSNNILSSRIYVDGLEKSLSVLLGVPQNRPIIGPLTIGSSISSLFTWQQKMDEIVVWADQVILPSCLSAIQVTPDWFTDVYSPPSPVSLPAPYLYWSLDATSGTIVGDQSGNGHHGTCQSISFSSNSASGVFGSQALDIPNSGYIVSDSAVQSSGATWTVSMWFTVDTLSSGTLISFGNSNSDVFDLIYDPNYGSGGSLSFNSNNADLWGFVSANSLLVANGWHHIVATFVSNNMPASSLYLDGTAMSLQVVLGAPQNVPVVGKLHIGAFPSGVLEHDGKVDEVQLFEGAVSAQEAYAMYWRRT